MSTPQVPAGNERRVGERRREPRTGATPRQHSAAAAARAEDARLLRERAGQGIKAAQAGLLVNVVLVIAKLIAGIVGHAYVLIADAVESSADIFSSLIVWGGLAVASQPADDDHPYGHGKAEPLAAAVVSLMLLGAALGITIVAIREIRTPHHMPAPWTLGVAASVFVIKWILSRRVAAVGAKVGSQSVQADAWHHRADAISSAAALVGISIALWGQRYRGGRGWEKADDWAAIIAAIVVAANGVHLLLPALHDLMDRAPEPEVLERVADAAMAVPGVRAVETLRARRSGLIYHVEVHIEADPDLTLRGAHALAAAVKYAVRERVPAVGGVFVHMEPDEGDGTEAEAGATP